jgi:hypothetical protein
VEEGGKRVRLGTQRESPRVVREIIDHDQVVLVARHAKNKRSPQITMDKIKDVRRMRRKRKRKANMVTQLGRMAEMLTRSPSARKVCTVVELSQHVATGVTKPTVPGRGRGRGGKGSRIRRWYSGSRNAKGVKRS